MLAFLAFDANGNYDLSSPAKRSAALEAALRAIAIVPQAYHSRGSQFVADEMHRIAVELLQALRDIEAERPLAPAPVRVERCTSCNAPAHPSETDDDGDCEFCRTGAPHRAPQRCEIHSCLFEACDCPACEHCAGFGCQSCGWTGRLLCQHCGRPRVGERDECGGIGEGICAARAAEDATLKPAASAVLSACFFCKATWGACRCRWNPDDGFDHDGVIIVEPNVSECGRFFVNPEIYYGDSYRRWAAKR